ncbi:hypothetical protein VTN77DRAFT_8129 [Rasamsonia byssochlamydoides]|uniref:uncharacterized protein n=1 Tax=Rasamsonia byssochlamydoides TaxID=89139 RepID=UPI003742A992
MPLHLLGKKSWNVYNPENIARVRRDEALAKAREEEQERRMQEIDAERRIQILRGQRPPTPPPPPSAEESATNRPDKRHGDDFTRHRKRRRLAGENDTDRDIRLAKEDAALAAAKRDELLATSGRPERDDHAPIVDSAGHINLFTAEMTRNQRAEKNVEAEAEAAKKRREYEDQYTMRFSNAAGFRESAGQRPWYSSSAREVVAPDYMPDKDVWGNEDPMRKERERARIDANDPLVAMKAGVRELKKIEQERKKWQEERARELEALKREERRRRRRSRSRSQSRESLDSLEGFSLDAVPEKGGSRDDDKHRSRHKHRHHHSRRHRHGSRERDSEHKHRHSHCHRSHRHRDEHDRSRHRSHT